MERKYQFREKIDIVHREGRKNVSLHPNHDETEIDSSWKIVFDSETETPAFDLQDYFLKSMGMSIALSEEKSEEKVILLEIAPEEKKRAFRMEVTDRKIWIAGSDYAGVFNGVVWLEDHLNLREAPFIERQVREVEPLFSPRMVHSGWGLDQFPDTHLNAVVHMGFDSILIFVKGINHTAYGFLDFADLIRRARKYAIGVYFYSYLPSYKHPSEPDAEDFFEKSFGSLFAAFPDAKGLILVGERAQFPSRDPLCDPRERGPMIGKLPADSRPPASCWPCSDYPEWLDAVRKSVRKYSPEADIVFWTYNWGRAPEDKRLSLIRNLPKDITLESTFEMFETIRKENHITVQPDYSITFPGPGQYFASEAECAKECGLKLYSMTNTGGMTWDFGVVGYVPAPQQWAKRIEAMKLAREKWGLAGLMDSHHYGWYPSIVSECAKWCFRSDSPDYAEILDKLAVRDFSSAAAAKIVRACQFVSDAMNSYTPGFDDQAGPLRCGPAYPFILHPILYPHTEQKMEFPTTPESTVGSRWIHPFYQPESIDGMSWCGLRIHEDIRAMTASLELWEKGLAEMKDALHEVPRKKREQALDLAGVMELCYRSFLTMLHIKQWWLLNKRFESEYQKEKALLLLDEMEKLIADERENAEMAIPLVERDSRLGWEPAQDYICDAEHLRWKIRQLDNVFKHALNACRQSVTIY